jgi:transcriptional regulator with XRE-family HTH domain
MLTETLEEGLKAYGIGAKIRALRQAKKLGLVQLGEHTGLSAAMLSKIERGQLYPTLPTLLRIAMVFGLGLDHFFVEDQKPLAVVVRKKDRMRLPAEPGEEDGSYTFESLDYPAHERRFESYFAEFSEKPSDPHSHDGAEFVYVLRGTLAIDIEGEVKSLEEGDALYFDSSRPHSYHRERGTECTAIVVVS